MGARRLAAAAAAMACVLAGVLTQGAAAADPGFTIRPSTNQVYVMDATPGEALELTDEHDAPVATGTTDALGSLVWRDLPAGSTGSTAPATRWASP
jgi:hypothetical protein